jgi:hypothetical protein
MEVPFLCIPMQRGTDFISGYRIIFWSGLSGRFGFKRNDGGGRGRRSHGKRRKGVQMSIVVRGRPLGKIPGVSL